MQNEYKTIKQIISDTLLKAGRTDNVKLLAVSKKQPIEKIIALYKLGQRDFGESYIQEAKQKILSLEDYSINWHFIGPIQSNKTKTIASLFNWVHSIDRLKIAKRLNQHILDQVAEQVIEKTSNKTPNKTPNKTKTINICLQININNEQTKSGFHLDEINSVIEQILKLKHLKLRGLMAIPKKSNDIKIQRQNFALLRQLLEQLNTKFSLSMDTLPMDTLSMGMSNDMQAAIMEGSTIIRVGTALFGQREIV
jgi:pyridoxal phosphate enzyme (YggS family)